MANLLIFAANMLPLAGVWFWGWDAFVVLIIYWAETVIVAGWTLARIATMPPELLGTIKVNGQERPGSSLSMAGFFALHAGLFIGVHLIFLLALFSGEWASRMTRPLSFLYALFVESGAWAALALSFVAGLIGFVTATPQPAVVTRLLRRFYPERQASVPHDLDPTKDHIGPLVGSLYARIFVMQIGIIFGAWFAQSFGNRAPLIIVIVLKSLIELRGWSPWTVSIDGNNLKFEQRKSASR
jgi:hypothetical protein